jgi:large subunit ribosomal protein L25
MEVIKVNGVARPNVGKAATKVVRHSETIPCVLYGGKDNVHFTTTWSEVRHLIYTPDFKTSDLTIDGKTYKAILKEVQFHPIDFLQLTPGVPVKISVPLRLKGQSPGVKAGGKLVQSVRKVKIKCLPEALVDEMSADISLLELGQTIRARDVHAKEGIELMMAPSIPVAIIEIPRALRSAAAADAKTAAKKK